MVNEVQVNTCMQDARNSKGAQVLLTTQCRLKCVGVACQRKCHFEYFQAKVHTGRKEVVCVCATPVSKDVGVGSVFCAATDVSAESVFRSRGVRLSDATVPNEAMHQRGVPSLISLVYLQKAGQNCTPKDCCFAFGLRTSRRYKR